MITHSNHRFDSDTHASFQHDTIAPSTIVGHLRILVHLTTDTMTGKFAYDTISLCLTVVLYSTTDITQMLSCYSLLDTQIERLS